MTKYEELVDAVHESEILYITTASSRIPAQSIRVGKEYGIFFNDSAFDTSAERYVALAHEKAHCDTGALYTIESPIFERERYENQAWKRTINVLMPFDEMKRVFDTCIYVDGLDLYEFAEKLEVTPEFAQRAIEHYHKQGYSW